MSNDVEADALVKLSVKRSDRGRIVTFGGLSGNPRRLNPTRARESCRLRNPFACRWTTQTGSYSVWKPRIGGCERLIRASGRGRVAYREVQRLKELYEQALEDIRKKDEQAEENRRAST